MTEFSTFITTSKLPESPVETLADLPPHPLVALDILKEQPDHRTSALSEDTFTYATSRAQAVANGEFTVRSESPFHERARLLGRITRDRASSRTYPIFTVSLTQREADIVVAGSEDETQDCGLMIHPTGSTSRVDDHETDAVELRALQLFLDGARHILGTVSLGQSDALTDDIGINDLQGDTALPLDPWAVQIGLSENDQRALRELQPGGAIFRLLTLLDLCSIGPDYDEDNPSPSFEETIHRIDRTLYETRPYATKPESYNLSDVDPDEDFRL